MRKTEARWTGAAAVAILALACSGGEEAQQADSSGAPAPDAAGAGSTQLASAGDAAKGEQIYRNVCTACHGGNPNQAGSAGPAIAGSSYELLEAKVLKGEYPPGYEPKRGSAAMPVLPYLKDHIADLAAYLEGAEDG